MKKLQLLLLLIPLAGMSQTKNVISTFRVFPKADKTQEFEKAFIAHAQKYHTGDWKWRVYEIQTGPDANGFLVVEGPLSWEQFDKRGDLGAAHTADWAKMVLPNASDRGTADYAEYLDEFSTVKVTDYSEKIIINHMIPKPGMIKNVEGLLTKLKPAWAAGNESVAVYRMIASGDPQILTVTRLKEGLKELSPNFRAPIIDRYNTANGANAWNDYLKEYANSVDRRWSELLFLRADMSSK